MLENLDKYGRGYFEGDYIFSDNDDRDENGNPTLETCQKWALYEIQKGYERVYNNLTLTYEGYTVNVSTEHIDLIGRTLELLKYKGEIWGCLYLADGDYDDHVLDDTLWNIRMKMIEKLDDLFTIKRQYLRMVIRATDPQTIKDIKLDFSQKGM